MALPTSPDYWAAYVAARCNIYYDQSRDVYITPRGNIGMKEVTELLALLGPKGLEDYLMCGIGGGPIGAISTQSNLQPQQPLTATQLQQQIQLQQAKMAAYAAQIQAQITKGMSFAALAVSPPHAKWSKKAEAMVAGEIIGYRAWGLIGTKLKSVAADYIWEPKQVAEGKPLDGFGIHAYKSPYILMVDQMHCSVYGSIAMWGDVIEHEDGYRSQYARVLSFEHWDRLIPQSAKDTISRAYLEETKPAQG